MFKKCPDCNINFQWMHVGDDQLKPINCFFVAERFKADGEVKVKVLETEQSFSSFTTDLPIILIDFFD